MPESAMFVFKTVMTILTRLLGHCNQLLFTYTKPILSNDKYAQIDLSIDISEVDPYDATTVFKNGSYRGEVKTLRDGALNYWGIKETE